MKSVGFILVILFATSIVKADGVQTGGSKKRNHHHQAEINVEEMIRAEEDPHYPQFLKEREQQKNEEKAAISAYQKQRDADKAASQRAQRQYLEEEQENAAREASKARNPHVNELKVWAKQQEKYRKQFVAEQNKQIEKLNSERMARMPASSN